MKKKKIGIIWADPYQGNRGVGALAYSALFLLEIIAKKSNKKFEYVLIGTKQGYQKLEIDDHYHVSFTGIRVIKGFKSLLSFIKYPKYLFEILRLEYVLDIGAGDSFSDIYGRKRFNEINFTKKFFKIVGIKQLLLPQTIGPFYDENVKKEAIKSLNKSHAVFARDINSFDYTKNIATPRKLFESIDMAFFMPYKKSNLNDNDKIKVGLNISGLLWNGGYTGNNEFNLKVNYQNLMNQIIEWFLDNNDVTVYLVPHVVHNYINLENDYAISLELQKKYSNKNLRLSPFFLTPIEAKNFISGLDFFIGARMHSCIAAFSTCVPVYPLAYSRKFNGLFGETLRYPFYGDMVKQKEEVILNNLVKSFKDKESLKKSIQLQMETIVKEKQIKLIDEMTKFLDEK